MNTHTVPHSMSRLRGLLTKNFPRVYTPTYFNEESSDELKII